MTAAISCRPLSTLVLVAACISACTPDKKVTTTPDKPLGVCQMPLPRRNGGIRPMRTEDWMRLILVTETYSGGQVLAQQTCTNRRIEHVPLPRDCEVQTPDPGVPEPVPLSEASVTERLMPDNRRLIWIMTHRFPNGDGFGPVAAVTVTDEIAYVGSIGLLRLRPQRVDLNLWQIGSKTVLMAAGETCVDPQDASTCRRAANLLVFDQGTFHSLPIRRAVSKECIDLPWVEYKREADLTLENGWNRHMRIVASLDHDQRYVVITEQVDVADTDPNHPDIPARDVRRIDTERFIHVEGPNLFTRQSPLWPRIIPSQGRTHVRGNEKNFFTP